MPQAFNYEFSSTLIVESIHEGDQAVAEKYGISVRTIQRYRKRFANGDPVLSQHVAKKREIYDRQWARSIKPALREGVEFMRKVFKRVEENPNLLNNPDMIRAVMESGFRTLAEVDFTNGILDARLNLQNREAGEVARETPATSTDETD